MSRVWTVANCSLSHLVVVGVEDRLLGGEEVLAKLHEPGLLEIEEDRAVAVAGRQLEACALRRRGGLRRGGDRPGDQQQRDGEATSTTRTAAHGSGIVSGGR